MTMQQRDNIVKRVVNFYIDGFREMTLGRTLWAIILLKLFIMFAIIRTLFFPNFLASVASNDDEKAEYVREQLLQKQTK